jgi:hypothetical protein
MPTLASTGALLIAATMAAGIGYAAGAHEHRPDVRPMQSVDLVQGPLCGQARSGPATRLRFESMTLAELEAMAIDVDANTAEDAAQAR